MPGSKTNSTKYIIGGVAVVCLLIIAYFLFLCKGEDVKKRKKKNNLNIAMNTTGAIVEKYEIGQTTFTEKSCEIMADMIFGTEEDGGLNVIYEDVMGKKFPEERFQCKGRSEDDVKSDTKKIANQYIVDMYAKILKNKDVTKRNNDLVSVWVLLGNIVAKAVMPLGMYQLSVERDDDEIKTIQFSLNDGNETFIFTPKLLIERANIEAEAIRNNVSAMPKERNLTKQLATPLVNSQEIERLQYDTNPEMSIDTVASLIIYELSQTGFSSPLG